MEFRPVHFATDRCFDLDYYDYRYINFTGILVEDLDFPVKIRQNWSLGKGGSLWDASFVLAKYLQSLPITGKNVIELGAGTALPSIICALKGANVVATDLSEILQLTEENISLNKSEFSGSLKSDELNWCDHLNHEKFLSTSWDYIIMSDVFYLPSIAHDFGETLKKLKGENTKIILTYKKRVDHTIQPYLQELNSYHCENLDNWARSVHPNPAIHLLSLS